MGIIAIYTDTAAQIQFPNIRRVKIITTDNLATVTTAGYLNPATLQGYTIYNTDEIVMWYGATATPAGVSSPGTFETFTPSISNGVITLTQWVNPGDVLLPVVANHIAVFNGTSGQITGDLSPAINGGNIQAGLSGTAGTLASFPATAANGSFIFKAINNSGGFNSTLSNSNIAQATVYSLPDTTSATANVLAAGSALVNGNLVQASGTGGATVDSGITATSVSSAITQLGVLNQVSVTLNTATMTTAFATPAQLIAGVAGKVIQIISASVYTASTGNTPYATGTAPIIQYGNTVHGGGTLATGAGLVDGDITAASSQVRTLGPIASSALTGFTNTGIFFSNATNNYTAGTGTNVTFNITYMLITATI